MTDAARLAIQKFTSEYYSKLYLRTIAGWCYRNLFRSNRP